MLVFGRDACMLCCLAWLCCWLVCKNSLSNGIVLLGCCMGLGCDAWVLVGL